ncbi:putative EF-hand domain, Tudor domain, EF-hand domain pair, Agenet domain, plant type, PUB [Plasmopara halstedii]
MKRSLRVGDSVKAKYKRGTKYFPGTITRERTDGTYDIQFEDGDIAERVDEKSIQQVEKVGDQKFKFQVGDIVKAPFERSSKLYRGKISRVHSDGTYDVDFDDGDKDTHIGAKKIQVENLINTKKVVLKAGDAVKARFKKGTNFFDGKISRVRSDGTYDIKYDDGDAEKHVAIDLIEVLERQKTDDVDKSRLEKSFQRFKIGDKVRARYNKGSKKVKGEIIAVHRDDTYDIRYDDGDKEKHVLIKDIELEVEERESRKIASILKVGEAVEATYQNGVKMFAAKISKVYIDGTYDVTFLDGDFEQRVSRSRIKTIKESEKSTFVSKNQRVYESDQKAEKSVRDERFESQNDAKSSQYDGEEKHFVLGETINARYKKGSQFFPGKITRVRSDGTYDVLYDDGDTEMYVENKHIERKDKEDKVDKKTIETFTVGDKVNARYKGGSKHFSGTIVKARMDGTFDITYDDGDKELRVKRSLIKSVDYNKKSTSFEKSMNEKVEKFDDLNSESKTKKRDVNLFQVHDVVKANFKQKGKFHRGKIIRSRLDGTFDIEYDIGAFEKHVLIENIRIDDNNTNGVEAKASTPIDVDREPLPTKTIDTESESENQCTIKKGDKVTFRNAKDFKSRRIGIVRKLYTDGTSDIKYSDGDILKRIEKRLLVVCSDSEDSEVEIANELTKKSPSFHRHESVISCWRRSSSLSKPRKTKNWIEAIVLEKNSDGTYTIRYSDGVVEEDVPSEALKTNNEENDNINLNESSRTNDMVSKRKKRIKKSGFGTESLFLLEQLAMTLFEEGVLSQKPKLQLFQGNDSSSSDTSSSSTDAESDPMKRNCKKTEVDKILERLFGSDFLQKYRRMFNENDSKQSGKISKRRIITLVEEFTKSNRDCNSITTVNHILTEWFATHDDLRIHRHFEFKTFLLALAYTKSRMGKLAMEQSVATVLEGRFASYHEIKRQQEIWQQKLGYRLFETLQRHFLDHALPHLIPSRIQVSQLSLIFDQVSRNSIPNKPLDVYLQQKQLYSHHTLLLPEFLCCYFQLYGSESINSFQWRNAVELRPIAFVASCLFSNGDYICKRHGDLVRRLSVGRTQAQVDYILKFREIFESLLNTEYSTSHDEMLLETSQLSVFAARVASDPIQLDAAMTTLRKRSGAVSLVEIYATCGFIIDEVTAAPTIRNAIDRLRMRNELADVRRIIGLIRSICVKILRFPNNADYWRLRADTSAFQHKLGRFDGGTSLLEAVGFVEYHKTHYELRGIRNIEGKRVSALEKPTLDSLREKSIQLDGELALVDGVESISSVLQRISRACASKGKIFTPDECQLILKSLSLYIVNILKNPKDSRYWRIREANSIFQRQIGYLPHSVELMDSIGFDLLQNYHGNVFTLRGTGLTGIGTKKSNSAQPSASFSSFTFSSISSQMEWFLWRRKQEIDSLLEDEMPFLDDIVGHFSQNTSNETTEDNTSRHDSRNEQNTSLVKMYPYGTNAIETFNKTSIQKHQLDMTRSVFKMIDSTSKGYLTESDFVRVFGTPDNLPIWSRFEAFDIGKDGKVDLNDFVAALGPLLDHSYELLKDKRGELKAFAVDSETSLSLCELTSLSVGNLRLETGCPDAIIALENLLHHLYCIIQEPQNSSLWLINDKQAIGNKFLHFAAGRELLHLIGFREILCTGDENALKTVKKYQLKPQRVRFKTSEIASDLPTSLDSITLTRIERIAAMLAGHYRGMKLLSLSDISAISRAISSVDRCIEDWIRVVQLALKCLLNIESYPENMRFRELNTSTNTFINVVSCVNGGLQLFFFLGFRETTTKSLALPLDVTIDEVKARHFELEVGLALLQQHSTNSTSNTIRLTIERDSMLKQPSENHQQAQSNTNLIKTSSAQVRQVKTKPIMLKQRSQFERKWKNITERKHIQPFSKKKTIVHERMKGR